MATRDRDPVGGPSFRQREAGANTCRRTPATGDPVGRFAHVRHVQQDKNDAGDGVRPESTAFRTGLRTPPLFARLSLCAVLEHGWNKRAPDVVGEKEARHRRRGASAFLSAARVVPP